MHNRRNFLKMLSMAALSTVMPKTELPVIEDKRIRLEVKGEERMRIYSNGRIGIGITKPNTKLYA